MSPNTDLVWDVVEEHLDEAELAVRVWLRAVESPAFTLESLWRNVEQRLLGHLDGLTVAGAKAMMDLLLPMLEAKSHPARKAAALMALLRMGRLERVLEALRSDQRKLREAAEWVLGAAGARTVSDRISDEMRFVSTSRVRTSLLKVAAARALPFPIPLLLTSLNSDDPAEAAAAAAAARFQDRQAVEVDLVRLLDHAAPLVREASLITSLGFDVPQALPRCRSLAAGSERPDPGAMLLLALVGEPCDVDMLLMHLRSPSNRASALFALGYSGSVSAVEHILPHVEDGDQSFARLAGEAFCLITGFDPSTPGATATPPPMKPSLPPLDLDDLGANLVPSAEEELPILRASAVRAFWSGTGEIASERVLLGKRWDLPRAFEFLERAPLRWRHPIGLWLEMRSHWSCRVNTRTFTHVQREQLRMAMASRRSDRLHGG